MNGPQAAGGKLRKRHVDARHRIDRAGVLEAAALLRVGDHADDLADLPADLHMSADGVAVLEVARGKCLVHDHGLGRRLGVGVAQGATAQQRQAKRLEVSGTHVGRGRGHEIARHSGGADDARAHVQDPLVGQPERQRRRLDAGDRAKALEAAREHRLDAFVLFVARIFERRRDRDQIVRIEAGRQRLQVDERANQQAGANQQHHAQRHFGDDQQTPRPALRAAGDRRGCRPRRARPAHRGAWPESPAPVRRAPRSAAVSPSVTDNTRASSATSPHGVSNKSVAVALRPASAAAPIARPAIPPHTGEHQAFDEQLAHDRASIAADREPRRNLARAPAGARQQQAGQVHAGDQQHHADAGRQELQRQPHVAGHLLLQRHQRVRQRHAVHPRSAAASSNRRPPPASPAACGQVTPSFSRATTP